MSRKKSTPHVARPVALPQKEQPTTPLPDDPSVLPARLREAGDIFHRLIESSHLAVCLATWEGTLLYANPASAALLGQAAPEALTGQSLFTHYPPALQSRLHEEILPQLLAHGHWQGELAVLSSGGAVIPTLETLTVVGEAQETPRYLARQAMDITAHKVEEEALLTDRLLLNAWLDNVPDHVYFKDRESRFLRISRANSEWLGLADPAEGVGKTDFDFFSSEHAEQAFADEQRIIATGQPIVNLEEKETWPDGHETWVSTTKMPLRDATGQIIGTFGISADITARKLAELERDRALRDLEAQTLQLRNAIEDMTLVQETMATLTAALTFEEAIDILLSAVVKAVKADRLSMFLIEDEQITRVGTYPMTESQRARIGEVLPLTDYPLIRQVIESRHPLVLAGDSPQLQEHARRSFAAAGIKMHATIPLIGRQGVLGTLSVNYTDPTRTFTERDMRMLQMLTNQTAFAFENIRLLEQTRIRAERERMVRTIIDRIRRSTNRDTIARVALEELAQMSGAVKGMVRLGTRDQLLREPEVVARPDEKN